MIALDQLLRVPCVDSENGFDLSPDGAKVAFVWNMTGRWEIYEAATDGSAAPQQISSGPGGKFAPHYSPNGRYLAYVVDFDGGENFHLFIQNRAGGPPLDLTPTIDFALQPRFAWSPDSAEIAFLSDEAGHFSAYSMPISGGERRLVLDVERPAGNVCWSPDGRWLAVEVEWRGQDRAIFIVSPDGGAAYPLGEGLNAQHPAWSPDSQRLAFCADPRGWYDIGIYDLARGDITWASSGSGDDTSPAWSPEGGLAYIHRRGALTWLAVQSPDAAPVYYQVEAGSHAHPAFTPDGRQILLTFNNPRHPDDLWRLTLEDKSFCQVTHSLPTELRNEAFIVPTEIDYPSTDGTPVPALLYRPPQSDQMTPAVVVIHGGPDWQFSVMWQPLLTHLVSRGWVVLAPNYRGSTGYGRAWQMANRFDMGGVDTRDCAAGALYLAREGLANSASIAVAGRSHGGYLTMTCLTQFPDLWAAGSAEMPFLNWFTAHENSRADLRHWDIENMGDPQENYDQWYERSPFFFLERLKAPVQLICGEHDPRCPPSEALAACHKLRELGREVELLLYPDEGHIFLKIENLIDAEVRRVSFLANILEMKRRGNESHRLVTRRS